MKQKALRVASGMIAQHPTATCTHATSAILIDGWGGFKRSCLACGVERNLTTIEARRVFGTAGDQHVGE